MSLHVLMFSCEKNIYALPIVRVVHVIWALEITPLPESPPIVCGVFDLHGKTIPVISFRRLLSLPEKDLELEDTFIIVNIHGYQIALLSDHIIGVFELQVEDTTEAKELFSELVMTQVVKYEERLIPLLDIDSLIDHEIVHVGA